MVLQLVHLGHPVLSMYLKCLSRSFQKIYLNKVNNTATFYYERIQNVLYLIFFYIIHEFVVDESGEPEKKNSLSGNQGLKENQMDIPEAQARNKLKRKENDSSMKIQGTLLEQFMVRWMVRTLGLEMIFFIDSTTFALNIFLSILLHWVLKECNI